MKIDKYKQVLDKMKNETNDEGEKLVRVAGVISEYVKEAYGIELIVVGGLSVELYTEGGYTTRDIDFVGVGHDKIMQALEDLGFKRLGKDSFHEELKVYVEVPGSTLKDSNGKYIRQIITRDGFSLSIIGIEDIIKDRLRALVQWKEYMQEEWVYQLTKIHWDVLDREYIRDTIGEKERAVFDDIVNVIQDVYTAESQQFQLRLFMDKESIPYSLFLDSIIALPAGYTYYGFSIAPLIMAYEYEEDEEGDEFFAAIQEDALQMRDLVEWLSHLPSQKIKHLDKVISYLKNMRE